MINSPKVSLLVPVYNVEKYIGKCVHSLFKQSYNNIEFIFVEDCSQDNSISIVRDIIQQYPFRKKNAYILSHERNRGVAAARNTAIEHASGDYIMYVDSDDYIDTNAVTLLVQKLEETEADIVLSDTYYVYENRVVLKREPSPESIQKYMELILKRQTSLCMWGKLIKKDLFYDVRFEEKMDFGEDYSVLPCLAYNAKKIAKINTALYYYIQFNINSYTRNLNLKSLNQVCAANEHISTYLLSKSADYKNLLLQSKLYLKLHLLKSVYKDKNLFKEVVDRFKEVDNLTSQLGFPDRAVFYFSKKHYYILLTTYLNICIFIKKAMRLS